jgi:hypothetical protein
LAFIRDRLFDLGFDQAVFLDGSDSSCLWHGGRWHVSPGESHRRRPSASVEASRPLHLGLQNRRSFIDVHHWGNRLLPG